MRHDRRSPARDEFGKPRIVFEKGSLSHPAITEVDDGRQTATAPRAMLAAHPDTAHFPNAKKTAHQVTPGENSNKNVSEIYRSFSGPAIISRTRRPDGYLELVVSKEPVLPTTLPVETTADLSVIIEGESTTEAAQVTRTIANSDGSALVGNIPGLKLARMDSTRRVALYHYEEPVAYDSDLRPIGTKVGLDGSVVPGGAGTASVVGRRMVVDGWENALLYVVDGWFERIPNGEKLNRVSLLAPIPPNRFDYDVIGVQFPGVLELTPGSLDPVGGFSPPFQVPSGSGGDTSYARYQFTPPRSERVRARRIFTYHRGPSGEPLLNYSVTTNAAGSRFFSFVGDNVVHPSWSVIYESAGGGVVIIEEYPASDPSYYDPQEFHRVNCDEKVWLGDIYERVRWVVSESVAPELYGGN